MEMPLKPNILADVSKENWSVIPAISHTYRSANGGPASADQTMLEDESGRLRLTGATLDGEMLVTGCIVSVLGTENEEGAFEVVDIRIPDLPPQPKRWLRSEISKKAPIKSERPTGGKIAFVSGLAFSGDEADEMVSTLLAEYLLGEAGGAQDHTEASQISRLVIVGNSISDDKTHTGVSAAEEAKKVKKYGYDSSSYNASPTAHLDSYISQLLPSLPVTILPGLSDPANVALPQQALHAALFPVSRYYTLTPSQAATRTEPDWFSSATNPFQTDFGGYRFLMSAGQNIDDMARYLPAPGSTIPAGPDEFSPLSLLERTLRWRVLAPTAPDTLWSYPFQEDDPFVLRECPHVCVLGNQEVFDTRVIEGDEGQSVRLISLPKFKETAQIAVVDLETLDVEVVEFGIAGQELEAGS
jgi:DNA polymerase delta subunit 2